jgi:hypothetical protein
MKKYYKITQDITLIEGENLLQLKKGEFLFSANLLNDKEMCAILGKDSLLSLNLVKKNQEIFEEISKEEFDFELSLSTVRNLFLEMEVEERKRIIQELYKEFIPQILFIPPTSPMPMPAPFNPYKDVIGGCSVCGNSIGTPCWSTNCPNRIQIWYSSSSDVK